MIEAVLTAVKIINSTMNSGIKGIPLEIWTGKTVDLSFKIFGCNAMVKIPDGVRKKVDKKSIECIFVGYAEGQKGYRLIQKSTKKLIISRDVIFFENESANQCIPSCGQNKSFFETQVNIDELREDESIGNSADIYGS